MGKFTIGGTAIALALILSLDTPRPADAAISTPACLRQVTYDFGRARPKLHEIFLLAAKQVCEESGDTKIAQRFVTNYKLTISSEWVTLSRKHNAFSPAR